MNAKPLARFLYANVPGVAAARFAVKDLAAPYFAKPEFRGVAEFSLDDSLVVDIGSNRGQSIEALRKFAPGSRIVAFEPEPNCYGYLKGRYRGSNTINVHGCALGASPGAITFFVPRYGLWNCEGMSATDYGAATEWLNDRGRMLFFDESKLTVEEHVVDRMTLDAFGLAPSLIKLHAQGAEYEILKGAENTVAQHQPALMVAFPSAEVNGLLNDWKYWPFDFRNGRFEAGLAKRPRTFTWYLPRGKAPTRG